MATTSISSPNLKTFLQSAASSSLRSPRSPILPPPSSLSSLPSSPSSVTYSRSLNLTTRRSIPVSKATSTTAYSPEIADVLADVSIFTASGEPVMFKDLWDQNEGVAVVALLRHFGCPCCWELATTLKESKERLESAGAKLIAIGVGAPNKARILAERLPFPLESLYADPERKAYDVLGLYYGIGRTFFNPASAKVLSRYDALQKAVKNYTIEATPDDRSGVLQQGKNWSMPGRTKAPVTMLLWMISLTYAPKLLLHELKRQTRQHIEQSSNRTTISATLELAKDWDMESEEGKLFVGGLLRETSEETLKQHFSKYGQVKQCQVMKDFTGRSRGFGFVTFVDPSHVHQALTDDSKHPMIDGRAVEVKPAKPREVRPYNHNGSLLGGIGYANKNYTHNDHDHHQNQQQDFKTKKIFVGGLAAGLNNDDFKKYFEDYGTVTDAVVMHDRKTREPRGFGFITFDSEDSVDNVLQRQRTRFHEIGNKRVEVKKATPKETSCRVNLFNAAYKPGFELGFGGSGYGNYYPWSCCYYDPQGNPYSQGLRCYYYAAPSPYPSYNYAPAPHFYGGSNSWNRADDHANYSSSTPIHKYDDGKERAENSRVDNSTVGNEERAESSGVAENGGVDKNGGSEERGDYAEFYTPRAIQDNVVGIDAIQEEDHVGIDEQVDYAAFYTPRAVHSSAGNEDRDEEPSDDHADSGVRESGGGVCSRSNGNDMLEDSKEAEALIAEITSSEHMSDCKEAEAEAEAEASNGSDNLSGGATGQDQSSPSS